MSPTTLLVVDDDPPIRRAVRHAVAGDVTRVLECGSGRDAIDLVAAERPDVVVLDLTLPDMEGAEVCADIRLWSAVPVIILSARYADAEKVKLLELGADDYVTKPFSPEELRARVRVQLRRASEVSSRSQVVRVDDVEIDLVRRTVLRNGSDVHLTRIEWGILRALLTQRGRTITHDQLFRAVWNQPEGDAQAYLRVHVSNLRRKLEHDTLRPRHILTEPGVGYRFAAPRAPAAFPASAPGDSDRRG